MTECLHCQINELIRARLEHDHPIDLNDLVAKIVECAAELIADIAPAEEQAKAVAEAWLAQRAALGFPLLKTKAAAE